MINTELSKKILIDPISNGAQKLFIVSGYATHTMASWHIKQIKESFSSPVEITLLVGMCSFDGISKEAHAGFKELSSDPKNRFNSQYVYQGAPVHSKIYIWLKNDVPFLAFSGSANYTQAGFSVSRREYVVDCDPESAYQYFIDAERDSIYCNNIEVEDFIPIHSSHPILDTEGSSSEKLRGSNIESVSLSLLTRSGDVGYGSGINWGHRRDGSKREPNQAYIHLPARISRTGFFPLKGQHFSVLTDDNKHLILRVEQANDKAITTPLSNSQLGEYLRNRLGLANGCFVKKEDLERYGRTNITFYKLDDEHFFMDFSI